MKLNDRQKGMLDGSEGEAKAFAMRVITQLGDVFGAQELMPVSQVHVDGCCYQTAGDAGLDFAEKLASLGGKVVVPTTTNVSGRDIRRWREHGFTESLAEKNRRMEKAYMKMGAIPTWTCAPYMQGPVPRFGEQIVWAESNAIAFVNSVIGARTHRYGDFIDACCAVTGCTPKFGLHLEENRRPGLVVDVTGFGKVPSDDTSFYASLGYWLGITSEGTIPYLCGLPLDVTSDCLKALCAAGAASGSLALFHAEGITPEADQYKSNVDDGHVKGHFSFGPSELDASRAELNTATSNGVDIVALGCPHFSYYEALDMLRALDGRKVSGDVACYVYTNRAVLRDLRASSVAGALEKASVKFATDTCILHWPLKGGAAKVLATNSGKFSKYAPGLLGTDVCFGTLGQCVEAAVTGRFPG